MEECATNFFTIVVTDQNISQAVCPFCRWDIYTRKSSTKKNICREPSNLAEDDDLALDYYAKLDQILKDILDKDTHDLFQRKLRDRTLMKDPNFKWCYKVGLLILLFARSYRNILSVSFWFPGRSKEQEAGVSGLPRHVLRQVPGPLGATARWCHLRGRGEYSEKMWKKTKSAELVD